MLNLKLLEKIHAYHEKNIEFVTKIAILKSWEIPIEKRYEGAEPFFDKLFYKKKFLEQAVKEIEEENEDVFFSINAFYKEKKTENAWQLNAFVLDFDFYKLSQYKSLTPIEMYKKHIRDSLDLIPTAVVDSGNGLYVIYAFKNASKHCINLYKRIYERIYEKFQKFGMDRAAMNVTQVIRIPGTLNPKCNKVVEILEYNDTDYEIQDFQTYLKYAYQEVVRYKQSDQYLLKFKKEKHQYSHSEINQIRINRRKELKIVIRDLITLIQIRNKRNYTTGYRELMLYILRERVKNAGYDEETELIIAKKLNDLLKVPLSDKELINVTKVRRNFKSHKISTIIEKLNINIEEQQQLKYLKSKLLKDRNYQKQKQLRGGLFGMSLKQTQIHLRRRKVHELHKEGYTQIEIAEELFLTKAMVSKDLNFIRTHKSMYLLKYEEYLQNEDMEELLDDEICYRTIFEEKEEKSMEKLE